MLFVSYAVAAAAMIATALYLLLRLRLFVTATAMLVGLLLLIYGPLALSFTLSSGEYGFLIRLFTGGPALQPSMFPAIKAKIGDLAPVFTTINFSLALMYAGVLAGIEFASRLSPARAAAVDLTLANWNSESIRDDARDHGLLFVAIAGLFLLMLFFSIREHQVAIIEHFFAIKADNAARNELRAHFGGSPDYLYRVLLGAVAPMLVIWGLLSGLLNKSWPLLVAAALLFAVTMLGKIETLSKAPPAFFLIQIALAAMLAFTNQISWRAALGGALLILLLVYVSMRLIVIFPAGTSVLEAVYSRIFEVENETLVENFAVFPALHPFMWGTNIRPIAVLMGVPYSPSFNLVGYTWYGSHAVTSPSMFIADAWADFSYAGVLAFSIIAGGVCRGIDLAFLKPGKSVVAIAVLSATFMGVFTLLTTALNIALFSGGLLLAPLLAAMLRWAARLIARPRALAEKPNA